MKFCQYCGVQLEDEAKCTCAESQEQDLQEEKKEFSIQRALNDLVAYVKEYFKSPKISSEMKNREGSFELAISLGVSFILSMVILMMFLSGQIVRIINKSIAGYDVYKASYPFGAALLTGLVIGVIILALCWGALTLCDELSGRPLNWKGSCIAVAANLPLPILFILLGGIISLFSIKIGCFVTSLASISWIILGLSEIQERLGALNESKRNIFITIAIMFVINVVVCYISYKLMFWTVGTIKVDGHRISEYMKSFFNSIFDYLM